LITVAAFFWRDDARRRNVQLTREDVRIWRNMVERNLSVPHRIVCVTHRPDLIDFMPTMPLDMEKHVPGTCFVKLQAHKVGGVAKEGDRVLLMDIDCVVTGNIDHLVHRDEPAVWWKNPNFSVGGRRGFIQGSMQLFTVGATEFLHREFDPLSTPGWTSRRFGGAEQAWISERLNDEYPDAGWTWNIPHFDESDGVYGAGRLFDGKMGNGVQSELPANARIVFTPGDRSPSQPEFMQAHPWAREFYK
jgi:hypothetical protein